MHGRVTLQRLAHMEWAEWPFRARSVVKDWTRNWAEVPKGGMGAAPEWGVPLSAEAGRGRAVDGVLREGWMSLGARRGPDNRTEWALDPHTGVRWAGTDPEPPPPGLDPRTVWEWSRLQHLPWMVESGRPEDAERAWSDFESWWHAHPLGPGWAWSEGLEMACRAVSLVRLGAWVGPSRTPVQRQRLRDCLAALGHFIEEFPSRYSSSNNHRIGQLCGLVVLGHTTDLPAAERWRTAPLAELQDCVLEQIRADGTGAEQSTRYLAFILEWLLVAEAVSGGGLGEPIRRRMAAAARYLGSVSGAWGDLNVGDGDGGRVLWAREREPAYVTSVVGAVAALLERPELAPRDWTPDGRSRALGLKGSAGQAAPTSQTFPMGGWTQLASPRAVVWFDHGPMGLPPMRVHGHADALSVWWLLDGQPMWVDAGTLRYLGRPAWRNWLRSPRAHNTLRLGHRDAVTPTGPFLWNGSWEASSDALSLTPEGGTVVGRSVQQGGTQHRDVRLTPGQLTLTDRFEGPERQPISVGFLWHPALRVRPVKGGFSVLKGRRRVARVEVDPRLQWRLHRQVGGDGFGAWSPEYGVLEPTTQLVGEGEWDPETPLVTRVRW